MSEEKKPATLWALIEKEFGQYYEGLLVQGSLVLEITDGENRMLRYVTSPDSTTWAQRGMLSEILSQFDAENAADMFLHMTHEDDDE